MSDADILAEVYGLVLLKMRMLATIMMMISMIIQMI